jgi:hypothetical protein
MGLGIFPLVKFKDVISPDVYKRCENKSRKTWYSLMQEIIFGLYVQGLIFVQYFHLNLSIF